jgi:hypothetical protein
MEFTSSSLSAKEAKMYGYTLRINHHDGTFTVATYDAQSVEAAKMDAAADFFPDIEGIETLGSIDREPQVFLAW